MANKKQNTFRRIVTPRALFLTAILAFTIIALLCAQLLDSFQVLFQTPLEPAGTNDPRGTPPQNMWHGAKQLWKHDAKMLAVFLIVWSGIWPHIKILILIWVIHSGSKLPRIIRCVEWFGRWAFLDVYFVILVVLSFRLPEVSVCFLGMCTGVGWLQAIPCAGLYLFCATAVVSQLCARATAMTLWYSVDGHHHDENFKDMNGPVGRKMAGASTTALIIRQFYGVRGMTMVVAEQRAITYRALAAAAFVLQLLGAFVWIQYEPLFRVTLITSIPAVQMPAPETYSLLDVWSTLWTDTPRFTETAPLLAPALVTLCAICVSILPVFRLLLLLLLCGVQRPLKLLTGGWRGVVAAEAAAALWSHTAVFTAALALLLLEVQNLSHQLDLKTLMEAGGGSLGGSVPKGPLSGLMMSISHTAESALSAVTGVPGHAPLLDVKIDPLHGRLWLLAVISVICDFATAVVANFIDPGWSGRYVSGESSSLPFNDDLTFNGPDDSFETKSLQKGLDRVGTGDEETDTLLTDSQRSDAAADVVDIVLL